jgi:hypothetical protein
MLTDKNKKMESLPRECKLKIMKYLSQTCIALNNVGKDEYFWKLKYKQDFHMYLNLHILRTNILCQHEENFTKYREKFSIL